MAAYAACTFPSSAEEHKTSSPHTNIKSRSDSPEELINGNRSGIDEGFTDQAVYEANGSEVNDVWHFAFGTYDIGHRVTGSLAVEACLAAEGHDTPLDGRSDFRSMHERQPHVTSYNVLITVHEFSQSPHAVIQRPILVGECPSTLPRIIYQPRTTVVICTALRPRSTSRPKGTIEVITSPHRQRQG